MLTFSTNIPFHVFWYLYLTSICFNLYLYMTCICFVFVIVFIFDLYLFCHSPVLGLQLTHFVDVIGEPVIVCLNKIIKIMITGELVIVCLLASAFNLWIVFAPACALFPHSSSVWLRQSSRPSFCLIC